MQIGDDDADSLSSASDYLSERSDKGISMACPASTFKKRSQLLVSQDAPRQIIDPEASQNIDQLQIKPSVGPDQDSEHLLREIESLKRK